VARDFAAELWNFAVKLTREHAQQLRKEAERESLDQDHKTHGGSGEPPAGEEEPTDA
jgi:hypothetical protein